MSNDRDPDAAALARAITAGWTRDQTPLGIAERILSSGWLVAHMQTAYEAGLRFTADDAGDDGLLAEHDRAVKEATWDECHESGAPWENPYRADALGEQP